MKKSQRMLQKDAGPRASPRAQKNVVLLLRQPQLKTSHYSRARHLGDVVHSNLHILLHLRARLGHDAIET